MDSLQKTIKAYEKMGKDYTLKVADLVPALIFDFIKLLPSGGRVLDVGCTGGRDSKVFADHGLRVTGIDLVGAFLVEARQLVPRGEFIKQDLRQIDFPTESFDGIWAAMVLLHQRRDEIPAVLKSFHNILKDKGKLFVAVKEGEGEEEMIDKLSPDLFRFFTYFTEDEMRHLLRTAGFSVVHFEKSVDEAGRGQVIMRFIAEKIS